MQKAPEELGKPCWKGCEVREEKGGESVKIPACMCAGRRADRGPGVGQDLCSLEAIS